MEIESNESVLRITAPNGDSLELNKEYDRVTISEDIEYSVLMKLIKVMKKERNKANFSIEYYED